MNKIKEELSSVSTAPKNSQKRASGFSPATRKRKGKSGSSPDSLLFRAQKSISFLFILCGKEEHVDALNPVFNTFRSWIRSYGTKVCCRLLKDVYREYLSEFDSDHHPNFTQVWIKRNKLGQPSFMSELNKMFDTKRKIERRLVLTVLRCHEDLTTKPDEDIKAIITPSDGNKWYSTTLQEDFKSFLKNSKFGKHILKLNKDSFDKAMQYHKDRSAEIHSDMYVPHLTTKKGPIKGRRALHTVGHDLSVILNTDLGDRLMNLISRIPDPQIIDMIMRLISHETENYKGNEVPGTVQGRIAFLSNPSCKTRVVAVGNYFVQAVLKIIHDSIMNSLQRLPADGTYRQEESASLVKEWSKTETWSYDLTSATDRFPIEPQIDVLKHIFGDKIGDSWGSLMRNYKFQVNEENEITYAVGT